MSEGGEGLYLEDEVSEGGEGLYLEDEVSEGGEGLEGILPDRLQGVEGEVQQAQVRREEVQHGGAKQALFINDLLAKKD